MSQWNLIVDVALCENCNNCVLANNDEYVGNSFEGYSAPHQLHGEGTIKLHRRVRGEGHLVDVAYLPTLCNHCDNAPCIKAAGPDVIRKRQDGIVIIDPDKAKGRRDLVQACPYGAIVWNEEQQLPQNWIFDAHLLDQGWVEPRCAQSCPTAAITAVKATQPAMEDLVAAEKLEVLRPELNTRPRVYYKNLHRYTKHFVGGSVIGLVNGRRECVQGAQVFLLKDGRNQQQTQTDAFGDFKFDGLEGGSAQYAVRVVHDVFGSASQSFSRPSVLGEIVLPVPSTVLPRAPGSRDPGRERLPHGVEDGTPPVIAPGSGSAI